MNGGPSQLDTWDYKPNLKEHFDKDLPDSIRMGQRITTMTSGQARRLTHALNPAINEDVLVEATIVRYPGEGGVMIPAVLYKPKGASAAHPAPAIVLVHGAWAGAWALTQSQALTLGRRGFRQGDALCRSAFADQRMFLGPDACALFLGGGVAHAGAHLCLFLLGHELAASDRHRVGGHGGAGGQREGGQQGGEELGGGGHGVPLQPGWGVWDRAAATWTAAGPTTPGIECRSRWLNPGPALSPAHAGSGTACGAWCRCVSAGVSGRHRGPWRAVAGLHSSA